MNLKTRNSLLLLQNRQGILSAYLQNEELNEAAKKSIDWSDEPRTGIESLWSDEPSDISALKRGEKGLRSIHILDSFFSDTLVKPDNIRDEIFSRAVQGVPVKFLLADPRGSFGKARAEAIKQSAMHRSREGLQKLAIACNEVRSRVDDSWVSLEQKIADAKDNWEETAELLLRAVSGLNVEVRLYHISPSGPLYFFSHLLIAGRFWANHSAAHLPWEHIIDTPIPNDLYDIMLAEFFAVWKGARELSACIHHGPRVANPMVFISCCRADETLVMELKQRIESSGIGTHVFWADNPTGAPWPQEVRKALNECGVLLAVLTSNALNNSDWVRAEIGGAWALGKQIMQARVGNAPKILPGILHEQWAEDVTSSAGKDKLIQDIKKHFGRQD